MPPNKPSRPLPHITYIDTNIKQVSEPLSFKQSRVLLTGRNGAGKTSYLNAVYLALFGEADDVIGRDAVKTPNLLRELDTEGFVHAHIRMSNGHEALWSLGQGAKPQHNPLPGPVHLPLRDALKALSGSRAVTLRYLYDAFGPEDGAPAAEQAARKRANEHKKVTRAVQGALETLGTVEASAKADLIRAIGTLTKYQVDQGRKLCGTCGQSNPLSAYQARYDKVASKMADLPPITSDGVRGLLAARDDAQLRVDHHTKDADKHMATIEGWFNEHLTELEKRISGERLGPLGPLGIKGSKSYILMGRKEGETIWPVVSGAETVVLALTLVKAARRKKGLNLLVVPDRAFDPDMFRALLRLASSIVNTTIFVQSVLTPTVVPNHWDHVHLDG